MKTVRKALGLLHHFSVSNPQWGLSELARAAGLDKATTLRLLRPLVEERLLEQDAVSRKYRLGHLVLNLARTREASFPLTEWIQPELAQLAQTLGEVAHASLMGPEALTTVAVANAAQRATRVFVDPSEALPYHATASGMVCLAFAAPDSVAAILARNDYVGVTQDTPKDADELAPRLARARQLGYAVTHSTFESEVTGVAVPFFDAEGHAQGAIAVAAPNSRVDEATTQAMVRALFAATQRVTTAVGGVLPAAWLACFEA